MGESSNPSLRQDDYSKWDLVKGWSFILFALGVVILGFWWVFIAPSESKVFVIQGVNDDCFRRLVATSENGPDEWSMKVCISANNGYVDEEGKVVHP
jgi:hypothetical protein